MHHQISFSFLIALGAVLAAANFNVPVMFGSESAGLLIFTKVFPLAFVFSYAFLTTSHFQDLVKDVEKIARAHFPILLLYGFGVVSALWSPDPYLTLERSVLSIAFVIASIIYSVHCSNCLAADSKQALRLLSWLASIPVVVVVLLGYLENEAVYRFTEYTYGRRLGGAVIHPNALGLLAVAALMAIINRWIFDRDFCALDLLLVITTAYALIAAQSRSAMVILVLVISFSYFISSRPLATKVFPFLFAALIFSAYLIVNGDVYSALIDYVLRDADFSDLLTLTNRTALWGSIEVDAFSLLFGNGFMMLSSEGTVTVDALTTNHAHNGFVQVFAGLGILGIGLLFSWISRLYRLFCYIRIGCVVCWRHLISWATFFVLSNFGMSGVGFQFFPHVCLFFIASSMFILRAVHNKRY